MSYSPFLTWNLSEFNRLRLAVLLLADTIFAARTKPRMAIRFFSNGRP